MDWDKQTLQNGKNIRFYRLQKNWSIRKLASKLPFSHTKLSYIEKGGSASHDDLQHIAAALKVPVALLMASSNERQDKIKQVEDILSSEGDASDAVDLVKWLLMDAHTNEDRLFSHELAGKVYQRRGMFQESLDSWLQMLQAAESLRSSAMVYEAHRYLTKVNWFLKNYTQAVFHLKHLTTHARSPMEKSVAQLQLAALYVEKGKLDKALSIYQELLPFFLMQHDQHRVAGILHNQADIFVKKGENKKAMQLYLDSYSMQQEIPDSAYLIPTTEDLFELLVSMKLYDEAIALLEKTFNRMPDSNDPRIARLKRMMVETCKIDANKERELLLDAYRILKGVEISAELVRVCVALGDALGDAGDIESAYQYYREASLTEKKLRHKGDKSK